MPPPAAAPDGHAIANGTPTDAAPEPAIRLEGGVPTRWCSPPSSRCKARGRNAQAAKQLARRLRRWHGKVADQGLAVRAPRARARQAAALQPGLRRIAAAAAKLRGYRKLLSRVQDILGEINDLAVAKEHYRRVRPRTRRPGSRWAGSARGWKSWRRKRSRLSTTWRTASRSGSKAGAGPPPHRVADEKRASFAGRPWRFKARSRS